MGKVKKRNPIKKSIEFKATYDVTINEDLDSSKYIFTSNKLEEANKVLRNLELPKFDKDGNYIP